jgi:hypothetical protein
MQITSPNYPEGSPMSDGYQVVRVRKVDGMTAEVLYPLYFSRTLENAIYFAKNLRAVDIVNTATGRLVSW